MGCCSGPWASLAAKDRRARDTCITRTAPDAKRTWTRTRSSESERASARARTHTHTQSTRRHILGRTHPAASPLALSPLPNKSLIQTGAHDLRTTTPRIFARQSRRVPSPSIHLPCLLTFHPHAPRPPSELLPRQPTPLAPHRRAALLRHRPRALLRRRPRAPLRRRARRRPRPRRAPRRRQRADGEG